MSMNKPWLLYVTADPPDEGSAYRRRARAPSAMRYARMASRWCAP